MEVITRFAPSPTGHLHLGHAYSAWLGWQRARHDGGCFRLRLEDIDTGRCKLQFALDIIEDLHWLGLDWDGDIRVQSAHLPEYRAGLDTLEAQGLLYPCFCSRSEIARALTAPHGSEQNYPGTCRNLTAAERCDRIATGKNYALRLHSARALQAAGDSRFYDEDIGWVTVQPERLDDAILGRRDNPTSYHLCVVHDDAMQKITHITRADDLREATHIHVLLQRLLKLPTPVYAHHRLLTDDSGKRLAKRDNAATLRGMRAAGISSAAVLERLRMIDTQFGTT